MLVLILVSIVVSTVLTPRFGRRVQRPGKAEPELGERVVLAVQDGRPSRGAVRIAARLARHHGGVVETLLVRRGADGEVDRTPLDDLVDLSTKEGFDGDVHVAVDHSIASAVVHGSTDLGASLVVVETDLDPDGGRSGTGHWEEAVASTIPVPLVLVSPGREAIRRVVLGPLDHDAVGDAAAAFVRELAEVVGGGDVVELHEPGADWVDALRQGDLAPTAVPSFELIIGLPSPPPGATLAAVPAPTVARWRAEPERPST